MPGSPPFVHCSATYMQTCSYLILQNKAAEAPGRFLHNQRYQLQQQSHSWAISFMFFLSTTSVMQSSSAS